MNRVTDPLENRWQAFRDGLLELVSPAPLYLVTVGFFVSLFVDWVQVQFQCCFTSTETVWTIRDSVREPRTATSSFTQHLSSDWVHGLKVFLNINACVYWNPMLNRQRKITLAAVLGWRYSEGREVVNPGTAYLPNEFACTAPGCISPLPFLAAPALAWVGLARTSWSTAWSARLPTRAPSTSLALRCTSDASVTCWFRPRSVSPVLCAPWSGVRRHFFFFFFGQHSCWLFNSPCGRNALGLSKTMVCSPLGMQWRVLGGWYGAKP